MPNTDVPFQSNKYHYHRIGFVSTSRADAGIYEPLVEFLVAQKGKQLFFFAGGTHLSQRFGRTIDQLPNLDRLQIFPVDHHIDGDTPVDVAALAAKAVDGFSRAFASAKPDLLFVLGDRTEMLAAALAATIHRIPIAHIHGGESTAGAYDDACRHAITKLAHVHFAALPQYAARIIAMNEQPSRVHTVGALALDRLRDFKAESIEQLSAAVGVDFAQPTLVVVFHVETLATVSPAEQIDGLLKALQPIDANMLFIGSNSDVGYAKLDQAIQAFLARHPRAKGIPSLPAHRFWSCLAHAKALVGNSSVGIIEASSFRIPVINIGDRQQGRAQPANVINCSFAAGAIGAALRNALSPEFRASLRTLSNPYAPSQPAAAQLAAVLDDLLSPDQLLRKSGPF